MRPSHTVRYNDRALIKPGFLSTRTCYSSLARCFCLYLEGIHVIDAASNRNGLQTTIATCFPFAGTLNNADCNAGNEAVGYSGVS